MPKAIIPPLRPVPPGATEEDRRRMFDEYSAELARLNPSQFNVDGSLKTWWQVIKGILS